MEDWGKITFHKLTPVEEEFLDELFDDDGFIFSEIQSTIRELSLRGRPNVKINRQTVDDFKSYSKIYKHHRNLGI
jgi:hypothetical protein